MFTLISFIVLFILLVILVLIVDRMSSDIFDPLAFFVMGLGSLVLLDAFIGIDKAEIEAFFDCHTAITKSVSSPTSHNTVRHNPSYHPAHQARVQTNSVQPNQGPTEIHLPNGQVYILQDGKAYQIQSN